MGNHPAKLDDDYVRTREYLVRDEEAERRGASVAVSHHPDDRGLVRRLNNALANEGRSVLVRWDEKEPEPTPELLDNVHRVIEAQDCFVAVVSPAYLGSELCRWELEHAVRCGKRLIPVEAESMAAHAETMPPALTARNAVFITSDGEFDAGLRLLKKLLDRDLAHLRAHTALLTRAVAWEGIYGRNRRLLLRGDDKRRAIAFLDRSARGTSPHANGLVVDFVASTFQRGALTRARPPPADALQSVCTPYSRMLIQPMPDEHASLFVSSAPEDADFAGQLVLALREQHADRKVFAHFEAREPTKEALDAVNSDIQTADSFVFVVSPDSLTTETSAWDLEHAVKCCKRIVPVVARQVDLRTIPADLAAVPWVFFDGGLGSFDACVRNVARRCDVDLVHVQYHSRLLGYAVLWLQNGKHARNLLRGEDLRSALEWATACAMGKGPHLTRLHLDFLAASAKQPSMWMAVQVPELADVASLPSDPQVPAFCREEWRLEVAASEQYMKEHAEAEAALGPAARASAAAAAAAAAAADEPSVFDPSTESLVAAAAAGGDEEEAEEEDPFWAPVTSVVPLYDRGDIGADPENEEAFIDELTADIRLKE